ncbi:hypothetical protein NQ317_008761 [Molorchus minor]|uniref:Uncharacterized protein n=1 Tax=Molorchus minor TaxID=1323400 RepID=A0ABQ9J3R4_9CUCU|nr:hypothetical protein NQ317_008761 [Molorchus minor]
MPSGDFNLSFRVIYEIFTIRGRLESLLSFEAARELVCLWNMGDLLLESGFVAKVPVCKCGKRICNSAASVRGMQLTQQIVKDKNPVTGSFQSPFPEQKANCVSDFRITSKRARISTNWLVGDALGHAFHVVLPGSLKSIISWEKLFAYYNI